MKKVLHVSNSCLAGAPSMLSNAQRYYLNYESIHLQLNDFAPGRAEMSEASFFSKGLMSDAYIIKHLIDKSDIIHVHNILPYYFLEILSGCDISGKRFVYHIHSPKGERPIYVDHSESMGIKFDVKLVVGHFHPRQFPDFIMVPNCLFRPALFSFSSLNDNPENKLIFSPSTPSSGRWNNKGLSDFSLFVSKLGLIKELSIDIVQGENPNNLLFRRYYSKYSIDELVTGSYHLVSYESMAMGNITFNNADDLSILSFCSSFGVDEEPPFQIGDQEFMFWKLSELNKNNEETARLRNETYSYFWNHMTPEKVVGIYDRIYEGLM